MKFCKCLMLTIILLFLLGLTTPLIGAEIRIHNNKTLTVTGKTLFANCSDTIIEGGASLILNNSALLKDMGHKSGSGVFTLNNSSVTYCYEQVENKSFYLIPIANGKFTVICL